MIANNTLLKLKTVPDLLRAAGVKVPDEITNAIRDAQRQPAFTSVTEARKALETAPDDAAWQAAATDLANAILTEATMRQDQFTSLLDSQRTTGLYRAVRSVATDLFAELAGNYNAEVPRFTEAIRRIPDGVETIPVVDVSPDVSAAVQEARRGAQVMQPCWAAYKTLANFTGHLEAGSDLADRYDIVYLLSQPNSPDDARYAPHEVHRQLSNTQYGDLKPLQPHASLVLFGDLSLCEHPSDAETRRDLMPPAVNAASFG